jgi:ankyrin repeat protein
LALTLAGMMGTALHSAAAYGCHAAARLLLKMGADVNAKNQR